MTLTLSAMHEFVDRVDDARNCVHYCVPWYKICRGGRLHGEDYLRGQYNNPDGKGAISVEDIPAGSPVPPIPDTVVGPVPLKIPLPR